MPVRWWRSVQWVYTDSPCEVVSETSCGRLRAGALDCTDKPAGRFGVKGLLRSEFAIPIGRRDPAVQEKVAARDETTVRAARAHFRCAR